MAAVAITSAFVPRPVPRRIWLRAAGGAVLPDLDAVGRPFGLGDLAVLGGHRALTHSLVVAAVLSLLAVTLVRRSVPQVSARLWLWTGLFLAIASHGGLDSMTTYGDGVEFLAPWSPHRFWAPRRLLGVGFARDTIAFGLFYSAAAILAWGRGLDLPGVPRRATVPAAA